MRWYCVTGEYLLCRPERGSWPVAFTGQAGWRSRIASWLRSSTGSRLSERLTCRDCRFSSRLVVPGSPLTQHASPETGVLASWVLLSRGRLLTEAPAWRCWGRTLIFLQSSAG